MRRAFILVVSLCLVSVLTSGQTGPAWASLYDGGGVPYSVDRATALALDSSGNAYVVGQSYGNSSNYDYLIIRYGRSGDTVWTRRYNGPGNGIDVATDVAVDGSGNVFVTGYSQGVAADFDYATIKFSVSGAQLWVARYDGPNNNNSPASDNANAIAVDFAGNACVTGKSTISGNGDDFLTVKYSPSGDTLWTRRYNGPASLSDQAYAIAIDIRGNISAAGYVDADSPSGARDFCTIQYGPGGERRWLARYDGPDQRQDEARVLGLDGAGNVYVAGISDRIATSFDYLVVKYDSTGTQQWASRYFSSALARSDMPSDIAVDPFGNSHVTGYSRNDLNWSGYLTVKYNTLGDTVWARRYDGPGRADIAYAIDCDAGGNVYITGESQGSSGPDVVTIKYDVAGNVAWIDRYDRLSGSLSQQGAYDLALNRLGELFVTGVFEDATGNSDFLTLMYAASTDLQPPAPALPREFVLYPNYPNPFNPGTLISYQVPTVSDVRLVVYDILGREVSLLVDERRDPGVHTARFDGSGLSSGVYFCRLTAGGAVQTRKMVLAK